MTKIANVDQTVEPVDSLTPHPRNPNQGDVGSISESIEAHGFYGQVIAQQSSRTILAGEHRWRAAKAAGMAEIPVTWVDVDDDQALRIVLVDNRSAELAYRDPQGLVELLQELAQTPLALTGTGYDGDALDELLADLAPPKAQGEDMVSEPPEKPVTKPGDLWELGPHRLLCGDSTDRGGVERLMGEAAPTTVFADPPYGVAYEAMRGGKAIANDGSAVDALAATKAALGAVTADEWFVCCDWRSVATMAEAMVAAGAEPKACIVWDKTSRVQNLDRFAKQHELILYAGPYGGQPTVDVDVWAVARDFEPDHPTPKPTDLVARALKVSKGTVYDPFGGSGTTLIAAENLGRIARLIELDPGYCDVVCRRYQGVSGIVPTRDGEPHDFLAGGAK